MKIAYSAFLLDPTGFGEASRRILRAMLSVGLDVAPGITFEDGGWHGPVTADLVEFLARPRHTAPDVHVYFVAATDFPKVRLDDGASSVLMTCWETDRLHPKAAAGAVRADLIIVPSLHAAKAFAELGRPLHVIPYPIVYPPADPQELALFVGRERTYVFYSVMTWQERKNPIGLLTAYLTGFTLKDNVDLVLKVSGGHAAQALSTARRGFETLLSALNLPDPPPVKIYGGQASEDALWALHTRGDCYVSLSRGEAFGLPILDAIACGNRVIVPDWGGHTGFTSPYGCVSIPSRLTPVAQRYVHFDGTQNWADPDVLVAQREMRAAAALGRQDKAPIVDWVRCRPGLMGMSAEAVGQRLKMVLHGD